MPTALELTRQEWQAYIQAARQHFVQPELTGEEQQQREQLLSRVARQPLS
jgi:hypothetical protein